MKQKVFILLLSVLMIGVVSGCSSNGSSGNDDNSGTQSIELWHYFEGNLKDVLEENITKYNEAQDKVEVKATFVPYGEFKNQLMISGTNQASPDLVISGINEVQLFAKSGVLEDMTKMVEEWEFKDQITKDIMAIHKMDGSVYGLPIKTNAIVLFYNKDMISEPPTTWEDLKQVAAEASNGKQNGFLASAHNSQQGTASWYPFLLSAGEDIATIGSDGGVAAMQLWKDMLDDGSMSSEAVNKTIMDAQVDFQNGNTAMTLTGPWFIPELEKNAPDLNWGVAEIPKDEKHVSLVGGESISMGVGANKEAAWDFISWFLEPENHFEYAKATGDFPALEDAFNEPYFQEDPVKKVFVKVIKSSSGYGWGENQGDYNQIVYTAMQKALTGESTVEDAMEEAQEKVDNLNK
ncbi:ABC transporter substrate-binding protein [Alkalihalobacillus sp. TS-13]|uniref:ABC transporter substrate-binding protein n=1 Tax=Alkalihalobacillus sp. TS-13 TaxID=2842455 RepID=UPI001C87630C|nr:ABC transporter substrate-binding protein [Alkalihalobacillus sp. TS-13]